MPHPAPDKWSTITEAVAATGKSERTIRRWIATQRLASQRKAGRLLVNLADIGPDIPSDDSETLPPESPKTSASQAGDCQAKVAKLEADVTRLSEVLAEVRSERDYLRQLHIMKEAKLIEGEKPPDTSGIRPPWWRFWAKD